MNTTAIYASRKRRKPVQKAIKPSLSDVAKSNPSKRHRDRLNTELDRLAGLLPFSQDIISKLDKLSVLRLGVSYLRAKGFFEVALKSRTDGNGNHEEQRTARPEKPGETLYLLEGELLLQALNGFVLVVTSEGLVFYTSSTIQDYLGFQQSDVIHQSVFELIHTEDRVEFQRQLHWALDPAQSSTDVVQIEGDQEFTQHTSYYDPDQLPPENSSFMERNFICRLRCLLDNSSGFLAMNFQGRLKFLHGQNMRRKDGSLIPPQLALFALATPLQSPSILEIRTRNIIFRTKHKLDFTPIGCDTKGSIVLGYTEAELCVRGTGYQFIHAADMMYCAENHVRMIKTGESGMTVFRLLTKENGWAWVQANARLVYKNGRPDYIIATQRPLTEEEGAEHLRKRSMQLPFMFATGEAVLYEVTFPLAGMMDPLQMKSRGKMSRGGSTTKTSSGSEPVDPASLLGAILRQDESVYICPPAPKTFTFENILGDAKDELSNIISSDWQENLVPVSARNIFKQENVQSPETLNPSLILDGTEITTDNKDNELYNIMRSLGIDYEDLELLQQDEAFFKCELDSSDIGDIDFADEILTYVQESLNKRSDCMYSSSLQKVPMADEMNSRMPQVAETQHLPQHCQRQTIPPQLCHKMKHMQVNGMFTNWNSVSGTSVTCHRQQPDQYGFSHMHNINSDFPYKSEIPNSPSTCTQDFMPYQQPSSIAAPSLTAVEMDFHVGDIERLDYPVMPSMEDYINFLPQGSQSQPGRVMSQQVMETPQPCYSGAVSMYPCVLKAQQSCLDQPSYAPLLGGEQPLLNEFQNGYSGGNIINSYPAPLNVVNSTQNAAHFQPPSHRTEPRTYPDLASSGFM